MCEARGEGEKGEIEEIEWAAERLPIVVNKNFIQFIRWIGFMFFFFVE